MNALNTSSPSRVIRVRDVFVAGGFPSITYQEREQFGIEDKLRDALDRMNKFIAVAGPTKSGKTVLVRKVVPKREYVWLEGGHINKIEDVWLQIMSDLRLPSQKLETSGFSSEEGSVVDMDASIKPFGIGAGIKQQGSTKSGKANSTASTYIASLAKAATDALNSQQKVLIIDDFHYIDSELQTEIIRALKPAVFDGLQVIFILIPHRMHQAASAEMDVDGRTFTISIPEWQSDELLRIGQVGFDALRVAHDKAMLNILVQECFSSPHMMQDFCSTLCRNARIKSRHEGDPPLPAVKLPDPPESFFKEFAQSISPEAFKALRKGPERTNRKPRELISGGTCDTYEAVLLALRDMGGATPVDWSKLRRSLTQLLKEVPQQHEVTRALENMDEIAKSRDGEPVIDYQNRELHLVDPFFRYFVKWNDQVEVVD